MSDALYGLQLILYSYVRYHRVSVGNTTHLSAFLVSQFLRSICAMSSGLCALCLRVGCRAFSIASIVNAFFGFIYRSLQLKCSHTPGCIPSHGSFESSYTLRTRAFVQRHVGCVVCVRGCVFVVSHQLILRGLESKLLARRVAAAPCSPPRGRTLVIRQSAASTRWNEDQQPVGPVELSTTTTSARYTTSFLRVASSFVGKHLKRNVFLLLLLLVFRCVFTRRTG